MPSSRLRNWAKGFDLFIALGMFETARLIFSQLGVNYGCSLAIMRSCKIVRHLLREAGASTEKNDLPDRAAARIAPRARAQMKRVLVLCAPRAVLVVETNLPVGAAHAIMKNVISTIMMCAVLALNVRCAAKGTDTNLLVRHAAIPKAETVPVAIPTISLLVVAAARASAKRMWARAIVASALARVRALALRGWPIASLRLLCVCHGGTCLMHSCRSADCHFPGNRYWFLRKLGQ